ncbi:MAG TPA: hypothetical protein VF549_16025 [Solirubrobacteraceae bacterium]|jgi:hypothetical protein
MSRTVALLTTLAALLLLPAAAQADGTVKAGVAVLDGTYHVGSSAGQYATARVSEDGIGEPGDTDPHAQNIRKQASYGVQARESVRALVIQGADGKLVALVSDDHYIPQDALLKRTAQLASEQTGGALNASNITMAVTHNHSSPSYSSLDPGVWTFQDVFDFRFFDYYARQNAAALTKAYNDLHRVRVSATASYFDKIQRNPLGPARADDGAPAGFSHSFADHDLSVIRFENVDDPRRPKPLSTLVNLGQHPEFLEGVGLITSEFPGALERLVDRRKGGVTIFTQNATGNSEIEQETYHPVSEREAFNHTMYNQMEWAARQLADGVIANIEDIEAQRPNADDHEHFGMASYHDRFIPWMSSFPVAIENQWFPGPVSHPYPGVNSCRTDPALAGNVKVGTAADCTDVLDFFGLSASPVMELLPGAPSVSSDDFEALGIPFPENVSTPSHGALEDTFGVHLQAIRLGDLLLTVCSCEQWTDQAYNIKTRTDRIPNNEWLGFDPTSPPADDKTAEQNSCTKNGDGTYADDGTGTGTWSCTTNPGVKLPDRTIQLMRSRTLNDAAGWDDPTCFELGCGVQAESEPTDLKKIRGNYTHDDTTIRGGRAQTGDYANTHGYKMVVTISMANDYNGYIATYRDYMGRDHYRKALTGWGPHSSDYFATRLARLGHALKGDAAARQAIDQETDPAKAGPGYHPGAVKEVADQQAEEAKVRAVGEAAHAATEAYGATIPDDGTGSAKDVRQPKDIERFDAATFTWVGGNNYTDNPEVWVERKVGRTWRVFADQSGEVPTTVAYPNGGDPTEIAAYRTGGQVWKWTATFEAFVSRFRLVDPAGDAYRATPAGTYRFRVRGLRRQRGADAPYAITSRPFEVAPWDGLTVEGAKLDAARRVTFGAGPSHTVSERRIRGTVKPDLGQQWFKIGPVDFPDFARDQAATGVRYFDKARGYSAESLAQKADAEHYCLDCRFRDWLDATGELTATVTYFDARGKRGKRERITSSDGTFRTERSLRRGGHAQIVLEDRWGNTTAKPAIVGG